MTVNAIELVFSYQLVKSSQLLDVTVVFACMGTIFLGLKGLLCMNILPGRRLD